MAETEQSKEPENTSVDVGGDNAGNVAAGGGMIIQMGDFGHVTLVPPPSPLPDIDDPLVVQAALMTFSHKDLRTLCASLSLDWRRLSTGSRYTLGQRLLRHTYVRGRMQELIAAMRRHRPGCL